MEPTSNNVKVAMTVEESVRFEAWKVAQAARDAKMAAMTENRNEKSRKRYYRKQEDRLAYANAYYYRKKAEREAAKAATAAATPAEQS